jgi:hypothetical protein
MGVNKTKILAKGQKYCDFTYMYIVEAKFINFFISHVKVHFRMQKKYLYINKIIKKNMLIWTMNQKCRA